MASQSISTASTAAALLALGFGFFPETASPLQGYAAARHVGRPIASLLNTSRKSPAESSVSSSDLTSETKEHLGRIATSIPSVVLKSASRSSLSSNELDSATNDDYFQNSATGRQTSAVEKLVGEMRRLRVLSADWDGEGACAPIPNSLRQAEAFVQMLDDSIQLPEPMLHANGRAGLYWNDSCLYADLEFLGDDRMAYFIERNGDKHKGVLRFDTNEMPPVFATLLQA